MNQDEVDAMLSTCGEEKWKFLDQLILLGVPQSYPQLEKTWGRWKSPNSEDALEHNIVSVQPQYTWTQVVGDKLYKGQLFDSFEDAFGYYKDHARRSRFEIRKATTKISKNGGGYSRSGRGVAQRCGDHQNGKTMAQTVFGKPETGSKVKTEVKSPKISVLLCELVVTIHTISDYTESLAK
ncbi:hypothetical protein LXL04_020611 [Taraxacum kok-saghyz]